MTADCLHRVRSHEGAGLTIRIPRQLTGAAPPLSSPPNAHSRPHRHPSVSKSKSLTTSMDKLMQHQNGRGSSAESSRPCSRGSTPSTRRLTPSRPQRTPPRTPDPDAERAGATSQSPSGSEVSLHSLKSNTSSISGKSNVSAKSSASGKSNTSGKSGRKSTPSSVRSKDTQASPSQRKSASPSLSTSRQCLKSAGSPGSARTSRVHSPTTPPARSHAPASSAASPAVAATHRRRSCHDTSVNGMANGEAGCSSSSSSSRRTTPPPRSGPATPSGTPTRHPSAPPARKPLPVFNSYMSLFQVQEKLKKGEVIEGVLRINPKNYEDAYISAPVILGRGDGHLYWRGT